jgi:hypothetical protein
MSGGDERPIKQWRDDCMDKIHSTSWKKIEDGYLVTTTVDYKGNHTIVREKLEVSDAK